jgi:hypothetical protein
MQTLQLSMRLSNKSWIAGDDDSDDEDPFADVRIVSSLRGFMKLRLNLT